MTQENQCYSEEEIFSFASDRAENATVDEKMNLHISQCERCAEILRQADEMDRVVASAVPRSLHAVEICPHIGKYRVSSLVGTGGMGRVYKAQDPDLERYVAIKVIKPEMSEDPEFRERFLSEAKIVARMNHPNIVHVYLSGIENGEMYLVMEYVDGESLARYINQNHTLEENLGVCAQIIKGFSVAHLNGIIHRDIKPSNIMINREGTVKLLDFGLARSVHNDSGLTVSGNILGTLSYMAPEVARGEKATVRSDIYSLGSVFYEMLTREKLIGEGAPLLTLEKIKNGEITPLVDHNPDIPTEINRIILKMCQLDPAHRYQSLADMEQDLVNFLNGSSSEPVIANYANVLETMREYKIPHDDVPRIISEALALTCKNKQSLEEQTMYSLAYELNIPADILRKVIVKYQNKKKFLGNWRGRWRWLLLGVSLVATVMVYFMSNIDRNSSTSHQPSIPQYGGFSGGGEAMGASATGVEKADPLDVSPIGEWESVDFVTSPAEFDPATRKWKGDLFLGAVAFNANGTTSLGWKWDGNNLTHSNGTSSFSYHVQLLKGKKYLFLPWLSGDVTLRGENPQYYVLKETKFYQQRHTIQLFANGSGTRSTEIRARNTTSQSEEMTRFRHDHKNIVSIKDRAGKDMRFEVNPYNHQFQYSVHFNTAVLPGEEMVYVIMSKENYLSVVRDGLWTYSRRHIPGPITHYHETIILPENATEKMVNPKPGSMRISDSGLIEYHYDMILSKGEGFECRIQYELPANTITLDPALLKNYEGKYYLGPATVFDVRVHGDILTAQLTGQGRFPVYPESKSLFKYKVVDAALQFNINDKGEVLSLTLFQNGVQQIAQKEGPYYQPPAPRKEIQVEVNDLPDYVGSYQLAPGVIFTVTLNKANLYVQLTGQASYPVYAEAKDNFFYKVVDAQLEFERSAEGKIIALHLYQNGLKQRAEKK